MKRRNMGFGHGAACAIAFCLACVCSCMTRTEAGRPVGIARETTSVVCETFFSTYTTISNHSIAVDAAGFVFIAGNTGDRSLPVTPGAFDGTYNGGMDAFVAKLSPDGGKLVYATYIGGSGDEHHCGIAVDAAGNVYLAGGTFSRDFPVTGGSFDDSYNGAGDWGGDIFALKLNPQGSGLAYSTFVGGSGSDTGFNVAVDGGGSAYIAGTTTSADFPVTAGAFNTVYGGRQDAFIARLDPSGKRLLYASFIGGSGNEVGQSVVIDPAGNAYVTGGSDSADFPGLSGPIASKGQFDVFVVKLNPSGDTLLFSTMAGGRELDMGLDIAIDPAGAIYATGTTQSADFPCTADAVSGKTFLGRKSQWWGDAFLVRINPGNGGMEYASLFGGSDSDAGTGIVCPAKNRVVVSGASYSADLPVTANAPQARCGGGDDIFLYSFDMDAKRARMTTYLGGKGNDETWSRLAADASGAVYLLGCTASSDLPVSDSGYDPEYNSPGSFVVVKIDP